MKIKIYANKFGYSPFEIWLKSLGDKKLIARILVRLDRLEHGNFGDHKILEQGVWELRFMFGSGLRIYFAKLDGEIVLLLIGGTKSSQRKDIHKAIIYLKDYQENLDET